MIPRLSGSASGLIAPKLETLLPPTTTWETFFSAWKGVLHSAWDPSSRSAFENYFMKHGIIQDSVLQNAPNGSVLIFALFQELHHNSLFQQAQEKGIWDAKEFHQAIGPALTNFHDALFQVTLNNSQPPDSSEPEPEETISEPKQLEQLDAKDPLELLFGHNSWEDEAAKDPSSQEAILQSMTTPAFYNQLFYQTQLAQHLTRGLVHNTPAATNQNSSDAKPTALQNGSSQLDWMNTGQEQSEQNHLTSARMESIYQPGSANIGQVAILRARAREIPQNFQYREFQATKDPEGDPVVAEFHILYEVTSRHTEKYIPAEGTTSTADSTAAAEKTNGGSSANASNSEETIKYDSPSTNPPPMGDKPWTEEVEYTRLGVAIVEGYLRHSHQKLQWRIPLLREPEEFAVEGGSLLSRTVLSSDSDASPKE